MLVFRSATEKDAKGIAALHAKSWQQNYRGVFSDGFLDNDVVHERFMVWNERFENPKKNQLVFVAEIENTFVGFLCAYIDDNSDYGTLIDNLHVDSEFIGQRIGEQLLVEAALFLDAKNKTSMYLWVLVNNTKAINFYERIGGKPEETIDDFDIGDREITKTRYHWPSLKFILDLGKKTNK